MLRNPLCGLLGIERPVIQASTRSGLRRRWAMQCWVLVVVSRVSGVPLWPNQAHSRSKFPFGS